VATAREPVVLRVLAEALLSAGAEADVLPIFAREQERLSIPYPLPRLARYRASVGRLVEAEQMARTCLENYHRVPEVGRKNQLITCTELLIDILTGQGRRREALEVLEGWPDQTPAWNAASRIAIHASTGALDDARAAARQLEALAVNDDPWVALWASGVLVAGGLYREAAPLLSRGLGSLALDDVPPMERQGYEAAMAVATGAPDAEARTRAALDNPHLESRYDARMIRAGIVRARGDCEEVVRLVGEALQVPPSPVVRERVRKEPQMLHWLAECHEKLGNLAEARKRNAEFLARWARADPDLPLLAEAKALQARLSGGPGAAR
jgi:tetratricopeptide (TPR) repeat protein